MKKLLLVALMAAAGLAHAEPTAAKKELIDKVLKLNQASLNGIAVQLADRPVAAMMSQLNQTMQLRVPSEKREALVKDIQADIKKYGDETLPLLRDRANKLAPSTIGVVLDEKFSEEELKQLITVLESPVLAKYSQLNNEMTKNLVEKLVADTRSTVEPKIKVLQQSVQTRVNSAIDAAAASGANGGSKAAPAAKPASK
ncbi:hypothetical protein [Variovorax sp. HJSM1_2]|uniref:hypothetical protein n=1 Tax=Variovorax sp. HJSM1_2 TaxID=3366263 RepID=UPI003BE1D105